LIFLGRCLIDLNHNLAAELDPKWMRFRSHKAGQLPKQVSQTLVLFCT